jgi:excisionase family DNA binding protein
MVNEIARYVQSLQARDVAPERGSFDTAFREARVDACLLMSIANALESAVELLTVNETANQLRISPMTVRRHIAAERLGAVRIGRSIRISQEATERFAVPVVPDATHSDVAHEPDPRPFTFEDPRWDIVDMVKDGPQHLATNHDHYPAESYSDTHER